MSLFSVTALESLCEEPSTVHSSSKKFSGAAFHILTCSDLAGILFSLPVVAEVISPLTPSRSSSWHACHLSMLREDRCSCSLPFSNGNYSVNPWGGRFPFPSLWLVMAWTWSTFPQRTQSRNHWYFGSFPFFMALLVLSNTFYGFSSLQVTDVGPVCLTFALNCAIINVLLSHI